MPGQVTGKTMTRFAKQIFISFPSYRLMLKVYIMKMCSYQMGVQAIGSQVQINVILLQPFTMKGFLNDKGKGTYGVE